MDDAKAMAWLAGLLEGEGTFGINRYSPDIAYPLIGLQMCDEGIVARVARLMGAPNVWRREAEKDGWSPTYATAVSGHDGASWMRRLRESMGARRRAAIDAALAAFRGTFMQQPPAFSAKRIDGTRSHKLARARARAAQEIRDLPDPPGLPDPVSVTAHAIDIIAADGDTATLRVECSAGFYVRALAHDLGERLGIGAHLVSLRRTRAGDFRLEDALPLEAAERDPDRARAAVVPLPDVLPRLPAVRLTADGVRRAINGCELGQRDGVPGGQRAESLVRLLTPAGDLVGVARAGSGPGLLHPAVVLR